MASVAVIGAGAAGISVARELAAGGATVTIFEARDRIGGRAHTDYSIASHPVELGAEFIHGESVATWDWVRELDAATTGDAHSYANWFVRDGRLLDGDAYREAVGAELYGALPASGESGSAQAGPTLRSTSCSRAGRSASEHRWASRSDR